MGLVTGVPYSTSLFGFNLGVLPRMRSRGLGVRLMHSLQAAALARFGLGAISATVDAEKKGLVEYYRGHGGVVESAGERESFFPPFVSSFSFSLTPETLSQKKKTLKNFDQASPPPTPPLRLSSASSSASTPPSCSA